MKRTASIAAVALMMVGSVAYAGSCGSKDADKEKSGCGTSCSSEKQQTACGGSHKGDDGKKTA